MNILDIDLDFFQNGAEHFVSDKQDERLKNEEIEPWSVKEVVDFLENKCHLDKKNKIPGQIVEKHHEVLNLWKVLIEKKKLEIPFSVYHVDAHSDLGLGDAAYIHILGDLIHKPLNKRISMTFDNSTRLNCGNYLAYALANQWLKKLNLIINKFWVPDLFPYYIIPRKRFDYGHHKLYLQLRRYNLEQIRDLFESDPPPLEYEPKIPFEIIPTEKFDCSKKFDYVFLAKSPNFTKIETDKLIPIISEYIDIQNFSKL